MKKALVKGDLAAIENVRLKNANKLVRGEENSQIVIGRGASSAWIQNLELLPKEAFDLKIDKERHTVTIKIQLLPGEYLAIMDLPGMVDKKEV
jgi:hypothetical protein